MGKITVEKNKIDGLYILTPTIHHDDRGYFMETYNKKDMAEIGIQTEFVQENQSKSKKGVLRGLHFQQTHPQGKLVRVISGSIFDVAVDLRKSSPTFMEWAGAELSGDNKKQLYIPEGFAHGFLVLSDFAEVCYQCSGFYMPQDEAGIAWNDPDIGIEWMGLSGEYRGNTSGRGYVMADGTEICLSPKDEKLPRFHEIEELNK